MQNWSHVEWWGVWKALSPNFQTKFFHDIYNQKTLVVRKSSFNCNIATKMRRCEVIQFIGFITTAGSHWKWIILKLSLMSWNQGAAVYSSTQFECHNEKCKVFTYILIEILVKVFNILCHCNWLEMYSFFYSFHHPSNSFYVIPCQCQRQ